MATEASVRVQALVRLKAIGRGQTPNAADTAEITAAYNEVYAYLDSRNLTTWETGEDVPDEMVPFVVALMCRSRLDHYGTPEPRRSEIRADASGAILEISRLQARSKTGVTEIESF